MTFPMSPADSMFLLAEAAQRPMHIGAVALLTPPGGGDAADIREMFATAAARQRATSLWRRRPRRSLASMLQWTWDIDPGIDLDYHVRFDAVPWPGRIAELWKLVAELHSCPLDRSRPLWRVHLIEGLADGRYAVYVKIHHALADGVSAMRLLQAAFSPDPHQRGMPAPWETQSDLAGSAAETAHIGAPEASPPHRSIGVAGEIVRTAGETVAAASALADTTWRALWRRGGPLTFAAPDTPFNTPIGNARSFAGCAFPLERLRLIANRTDATINDIVLTICAGALRRYLAARDALPTAPLVAMVPVSLRHDEPASTTDRPPGNKLAMLSCTLATHLDDPVERLAAIRANMRDGKAVLAKRGRLATLAISGLGAAPLTAAMLLGRPLGPFRPPNVLISNVSGRPGPLYWNGARLDALYPLSVPVDGQALNITCTGLNDQITFGLTGCRRAVPRIDALTGYLKDELDLLDAPHHGSPVNRSGGGASDPGLPGAACPRRPRCRGLDASGTTSAKSAGRHRRPPSMRQLTG